MKSCILLPLTALLTFTAETLRLVLRDAHHLIGTQVLEEPNLFKNS